MQETDQKHILDVAKSLIEQNEYYVTEYFDAELLAYWFLSVYNVFGNRKVITHRLRSHNDVSIIVSDTRISVILNEIGQSSWCPIENAIQYNELEEDVDTVFTHLDMAIQRAESNEI